MTNPAEIELRKPSRILGVNNALARLLGGFRPNRISDAINYTVTESTGGDGGGGPGPGPSGFTVTFNVETQTFTLSWDASDGATGYYLGNFDGLDLTPGDEVLNSTLALGPEQTSFEIVVPPDFTNNHVNFALATLRDEELSDSTNATGYIVPPINTFDLQYQGDGDVLSISWSIYVDASFYPNGFLLQNNFGFDQSFANDTFSFQPSIDDAWRDTLVTWSITGLDAYGRSSDVYTSDITIASNINYGNNPGTIINGGFESSTDIPDEWAVQSMNFTGSTGIEVVNNDIQDFAGNNGFISLWFKSGSNIADSQGMGLFTWGDSTDALALGITNDGLIAFGQNFAQFVYGQGIATFSGNWHNVIVAYQQQEDETGFTTSVDLWIDAELVMEDQIITGQPFNSGHLQFGTGFGGFSTYNGMMDDIRVYIYGADQSIANSLFAGTEGASNGLRLWYKFDTDQNGASQVIDSSEMYQNPT